MSENISNTKEALPSNNIIKDVLSQLSSTTFILIFVYVCGGLYLIFYWNYLDVYIFPVVTITEIPKSFIYPFLLTNGYIAFVVFLLCFRDGLRNVPILLTNCIISFSNFFKKGYSRRQPALYSGFNLEHPLNPGLFWCFLVLASIIAFKIDRQYWIFWYIVSFVVIFPISEMVTGMPFVKRGIKHHLLRRYLIVCIIATPALSIVMALSESYKVSNNKSIKYIEFSFKDSSVNFIPEVSGRLKLLGFAGDKIIASTINNDKKYFINQASVDKLSLSRDSLNTTASNGN